MASPIEVVVIRPPTLALPAPGCAQATAPPEPPELPEPEPPPPVDPLETFAEPLQFDVAALVASAFSPVRLRVLLALAKGEPVPVTALAQRMGEQPDKISGHLRPLRLRDLVHERQRGREHWYTADPNRIRLTRHADGGFALDLLARAGGRVMLTLTVMGEGGESPNSETRSPNE